MQSNNVIKIDVVVEIYGIEYDAIASAVVEYDYDAQDDLYNVSAPQLEFQYLEVLINGDDVKCDLDVFQLDDIKTKIKEYYDNGDDNEKIITSETRPRFLQIEVSKNNLLKIAKASGEPVQMFAWDVPHVCVTAKDNITLFFFTNEAFNDNEKSIIKIV
jgi:hypothetical protein